MTMPPEDLSPADSPPDYVPAPVPAGAAVPVDTIIAGAVVVTMDDDRRVLRDGAVAIAGDTIAAVGPTAEIVAGYRATETIDGRRFVLTPGLVNTHIHITGEPLTRGYVPDDTPFEENVFAWLCPLYAAYNEPEERLSGQLAALEMLRSGTTSFLEAGTIRFLDAVVDGLAETGIRGRVGRWTWDLPPEPDVYRQNTDDAIKGLVDELDRFATAADGRIAAWPILVGHNTCSDELWQAAAGLARERGTGLSFHMSPAEVDPAYFLATYGRRPMEHLADLGVLGDNVILTHAVHVDDAEIDLLAQTGTSVAHCPTTALKVSYGVTRIGKFPEMAARGVNVAIGTDGNNASNYSDLMRATYLVAGLFKDGRQDPTMFPAEQAFAMATLGGARGLGLADEIGVLAPGRKADLVAHDTDRPEWRPLLNVANQLVWSADGRGVHSVWVDGRRVVENYHHTVIDEEALYAAAQAAGEAITARSGLPAKSRWTLV
ncbi:amidohydrolase family protein [Parafrankia sp. EUN1f]|uniref:amidohydrolase family protein n=1 Tax=Parafrankia sp. EUN1f TaxID=102897 RepID=UPI0001C4437C|nr:amidohydrolase [Parafrankia sp. EUN1f]